MGQGTDQGWEFHLTFSSPSFRDESLQDQYQGRPAAPYRNHFILKAIWRNSPDRGRPRLFQSWRPASSFNRNTIGESGSASGAMAVKWLASGTTPNRVASPAAPQASTMFWLCRKYSALSRSPTTASRLPRLGAVQNSGLAARAVPASRRSALLMEVSARGARSNRPEIE